MLISTPSIVSRLTLKLKGTVFNRVMCIPSLTIAHGVAGQVEMKRVGIPAHVPCAVQQWEGLIAGTSALTPSNAL